MAIFTVLSIIIYTLSLFLPSQTTNTNYKDSDNKDDNNN